MKVLVTGAGGNIGSLLLTALKAKNHQVTALARHPSPMLSIADFQTFETLSPGSDFSTLLEGLDAVIHLADGFNAYEHLPVNTFNKEAEQRLATTKLLIEAAARHKLHLVYLSTVKAMCGAYATDILTEKTPPQPQSLYGHLKLEAEKEIGASVARYGGSAIILRFPIVFGSGKNDGNMERLFRLADTPLPLPFKGLAARRSLISATTLIDAATLACGRSTEGAQTYLLHDGAINIETLIRVIRQGIGRNERQFFLPSVLWRSAEMLFGLRKWTDRFTKPLELDDGLFRQTFAWRPMMELEQLLLADAERLDSKKV